MYEFDKYFDLNSEQKKYLKPFVLTMLDWIRVEKGQEIHQVLDDFTLVWKAGASKDQLELLVKRVEGLRAELVTEMAPTLGKFFASLSDEQIDYFEKKLIDFNEENEDAAVLPIEKFSKKQKEKVHKNLKYWLGSLKDEQEQEFYTKVPIDQVGFLRNFEGRKSAQRNFVKFLRSRKPQAEIEKNLILWGSNPSLLRNDPATNEQSKRLVSSIQAAEAVATAAQKAHVVEVIKNLKQDLNALLN